MIFDVVSRRNALASSIKKSHLESLVLQDLLDSHILLVLSRGTSRSSLILASSSPFDEVSISSRHDTSLKHDTKGTVADDFAVGVGELTRLSRLSIRCGHADHLHWVVHCCASGRRWKEGGGVSKGLSANQQVKLYQKRCRRDILAAAYSQTALGPQRGAA